MGILDFLGGLGQAGAAPALTRLTSGLGSQGGMLQQFGLGRYGTPGQQGPMQPGMSWQMGQGNNFADFLHKVGQGLTGQGQGQDQGGGQQAAPPPQQPPPQQPPPQQQPGLASLVQQYLQQMRRQ
jgi:hypothetical protein